MTSTTDTARGQERGQGNSLPGWLVAHGRPGTVAALCAPSLLQLRVQLQLQRGARSLHGVCQMLLPLLVQLVLLALILLLLVLVLLACSGAWGPCLLHGSRDLGGQLQGRLESGCCPDRGETSLDPLRAGCQLLCRAGVE